MLSFWILKSAAFNDCPVKFKVSHYSSIFRYPLISQWFFCCCCWTGQHLDEFPLGISLHFHYIFLILFSCLVCKLRWMIKERKPAWESSRTNEPQQMRFSISLSLSLSLSISPLPPPLRTLLPPPLPGSPGPPRKLKQRNVNKKPQQNKTIMKWNNVLDFHRKNVNNEGPTLSKNKPSETARKTHYRIAR